MQTAIQKKGGVEKVAVIRERELEYDITDLQAHISPEKRRLQTQAHLNRNPENCRILLILNKTGPTVIGELTATVCRLASSVVPPQTVRYKLELLAAYNLVAKAPFSELHSYLPPELIEAAKIKRDAAAQKYPVAFHNIDQVNNLTFFWLTDLGKEFVPFAYERVLKLGKNNEQKVT